MAKRKKQPEIGNMDVPLPFPLGGVDQQRAFFNQRPGTTAQAFNVRAFDPGTDRARGGARSGLQKYFSQQVVGNFPIQCLNHLVTNATVPRSIYAAFSYSLGSGAGFGVADNFDGTNVYSPIGNVSGYKFENSCWDILGNLYVAERNSSATRIYCINPQGATTWMVTNILCATTGQATRAIAGMCVIGTFLYIAVIKINPTTYNYTGTAPSQFACAIHRVQTIDGTGDGSTIPWRSNGVNFRLFFSPTSVNCLCGFVPPAGATNSAPVIGVQCCGFTSSNGTVVTPSFFLLDPSRNALSGDNSPGAGFNFISVTSLSGSASLSFSTAVKVVSDGSTSFYTLAPMPSSRLFRISIGGGPATWTAGTADDATDMCYDTATNFLLAVYPTQPAVHRLSLLDGSLAQSVPVNSTTYDNIDCDNSGNFVLWKNSQASNDVIGLNKTLGVRFGPNTLGNALHTGASVNKGTQLLPTAAGPRIIQGVAINHGQMVLFNSSGPATVTNGQSFSTSAPVIECAQNGLNMFFADGGGKWLYYEAATKSVLPWVASTQGTMPIDDATKGTGTKICTWRGRTVVSGFPSNPNVFYMSAQFDPFDWEFNPQVTTTTQAVSGQADFFGFPGQFINTLIPYSDDTLIFGCSHEIWQLTGDPAAGGQFDCISQTLGMAPGLPWCIDPFGQIYFFGDKVGIYKMQPGALPVRVSQSIERYVENIDVTSNYIRLAWDIHNQGLAVWVTPYDQTKATVNLFWEQRTGAWWPDFYSNSLHNPLAVHVFEGDLPTDQTIMLGGRDGYIRILTDLAADDDGVPIQSSVLLGPIGTPQMDMVMLKQALATMSQTSGQVSWSCYTGQTAEGAIQNAAVANGTWNASRNPTTFIQRSGFAIYVKIDATNPWSMERLMIRYAPFGAQARWFYLGQDKPISGAGNIPPQPTILDAVGGQGQVTVVWNAISGLTYTLNRSIVSGAEIAIATDLSSGVYLDQNLTTGQTYYYTLNAVNSAGPSTPSLEVSATTTAFSAIPPPLMPLGFMATVVSLEIDLVWQPVPNATGYYLYRSLTSGATGGATPITLGDVTSYSDTGLSNGTTYYYTLSAFNAAGQGPQCPQISGTPATTPPAPVSLTVTPGSTRNDLAWPTVTGATSYKVYSGATSGGEVLLASGVTALIYADTGLVNGTPVFYYIKAHNAAGDSPQSNEVEGVPAAAIPSAPTLQSAIGISTTQISLQWSLVSGTGVTYNVYRGTSPGGESATAVASGLTTTTYIDTGLSAGMVYYYKVASVPSGGGTHSIYSNELSASTLASLPPAPTALVGTSGNASVSLTWTGVAGATIYKIYRSTISGAEVFLANGTIATTYTDNTAVNGTGYYYTVTAVVSAVESPQSVQVGAITPHSTNVPNPPTNFVAFAGNGLANLQWTAATGNPTNYNIYRNSTGTFTPGSPYLTGIGNVTSYTDPSAVNGQTYYYAVSATNANGESSLSSTSTAITPINPVAPLAPSVVSVTVVSTTSLTVTWAASANATAYTVFRSTSPNMANATSFALGNVTTTTQTALAPGVTYYYTVVASNSFGSSQPSSIVSGTTTNVAPSAPVVSGNAGQSSVSLTWPLVNGATGYNIYINVGSAPSGSGTPLEEVFGSPATIGGLTNGLSYYLALKSVNSAGLSALSNVVGPLVPTGLGIIGGQTIMFFDTFQDANGTVLSSHTPNVGTQWIQFQVGGSYFPNGGIFNNRFQGSIASVWSAGLGYSQTNYTVSMIAQRTAITDTLNLYVRATALAANNCYVVNFNGSTSGNNISILRMSGGVPTALATVGYIPDTSIHTLAVQVSGNLIVVSVDGVNVLSAVDTLNLYPGNSAGLGNFVAFRVSAVDYLTQFQITSP